ncbi:MAG: bifunctional riboflavin kinase/FAD synthetase [Persicimonas sp.]
MVQHAVYRTLETAARQLDSPVVTIGNFDGVHLGHQAIFARVRKLADDREAPAVAVTFCPHPVRYFRPDAPPFRLTTEEQKQRLLAEYGLHASVMLDFNEDLAELSPEKFVAQVLDEGLSATAVVVGQDFAFGQGRAGTTDDLERLCAQRGIEAHIVPHVELDGEPVSSTRVRKAIEQGDMDLTTRLLGRPYRIGGEVVRGEQRGRRLGFPTANIATENPLLPPNGVYATTLHVDDFAPLHSITNVGTRPTFGESEITVETFVLGGDGQPDQLDLYGAHVELDFWKMVRPERAFESADELIEQIERDVDQVRRYFLL